MKELGQVKAHQIARSLLAEMPPGRRWHICKFHDEQFPSAAALDEHFASAAHNNACDFMGFGCREQFDTFQQLGEHVNKKRHGGYCAECKAIWSNVLYMEETHKAEQNKCHICGLTFHSAALLLVHLETNGVPVQYDECIVDIRVDNYQHPMLHPHIKPEKLDRQAPLDIHDDSLIIQPGQMYVSSIGIVLPPTGVANIHAPSKKPRHRRPRAQPNQTSTRVHCFLCNKPFANRVNIFNHLLAGSCGSGVTIAQMTGLLEQYGQKRNVLPVCPKEGCKVKVKSLHGWINHLKNASDHEDFIDMADDAMDWVQEVLVDSAGGKMHKGVLEGVDVIKKSRSY